MARVMREDYHVPANPHATLSSAVLAAHLPIVRADAIATDRDRDRSSGARFARLDAADLGGLERVLRETMRPSSNGGGRGARGSSADAFFVRPNEPAAFMRILCAARGEGAPEDAMARWGATRPKNSRQKKPGPNKSGRNTSGPNKSGWTTRKGRRCANGGRERRERSPLGRGSGDGTEVGSRGRRDRRGEDTVYAYLADDGIDPDEPL